MGHQFFIISRGMAAADGWRPVTAFNQNTIGGVIILVEGSGDAGEPLLAHPIDGSFKEPVGY